MGQANSAASPSREQTRNQLAQRFARKCFDHIELYTLRTNFNALADHDQDLRYLKEDTLARCLELPDMLGVSPVLFQMISYIGAFPWLDEAPAVLGFEQMIMVVSIMTDRYKTILSHAASNRHRLIFHSLAVYDRKLSEITPPQPPGTPAKPQHPSAFAVDEARDDDDDADGDNDDELVLAALDALDINDAFVKGDVHSASTHGSMIPADNFRKLIMLLLVLAPTGPTQCLSSSTHRMVGEELDSLRATADDILSSFLNVETSPGITFAQFKNAMSVNFPCLFQGLTPLFEHLLFSKELDLSRRKGSVSQVQKKQDVALYQGEGRIMNVNMLSQLSFFIGGDKLFHRLRLLFSGAEDGYSMGSFESKVFNWRAPTILLVSGTRIPEQSRSTGSQAAFEDIPPRRYPDDLQQSGHDKVVFGCFVNEPWHISSKACFGGDGTLLFQLSPCHDVFKPSTVLKNYISFSKGQPNPGISVGCSPPGLGSTSRNTPVRSLGSVSLVLDSSFEYGVFNHDYTSRGGAFASSTVRKFDFQTRFKILDIECWGCGDDDKAKEQRERWEWEKREAEARRKINLGTGDMNADRQLLELAGIIGKNQSGGSI